ncbi:Universal stress protein PHOS32 [Bienertia sinuspersici]
MDERKIVVMVEESETARTALKWALQNLVRYGDVLTLLHLCPYYPPTRSRNKNKLRLVRLKGYQLALSFKDICTSSSFNTKIEIVVTEDDAEGERIVGLVREIGAFALVLGLHDHSFFYRLAMRHNNITNTLNCKVLAIKQPRPSGEATRRTRLCPSFTQLEPSLSLDFSQIEVAPLQVPDFTPQKIPYQICPNPSAIIWRSKKTRRRSQITT